MPISSLTRSDIFRMIREEDIDWRGSLDDIDFLSRLYDLSSMPSDDYRCSNAKGDIWQHTVNNQDWDTYWIFDDKRFNLSGCSDEQFLNFLCTIINPKVRPNEKERTALLKMFNEHLFTQGYVIKEELSDFGKTKYVAYQLTKGSSYVPIPKKLISALEIRPKILFLAASPEDEVKLRLDKEAREIYDRILRAQKKEELIFVTKGAVRVSDLQPYLNEEKPTIVHFSGHGTRDGSIKLEDNNGFSISVSKETLARVFKVLKDNIRCVVLNACYSAEQAEAISENIDCVIGMSSSIDDEAAIAFSSAFYSAIASGRSLKNAFDQGINEIMLRRIPDEDKPRLLCNIGVDPEKIVLLKL